MKTLFEQAWFLWIAASLVGYLAGSLSFARIVSSLFDKTGKVKPIERDIPDTDIKLESDAVTATTVNLELGPVYGCLTSILDMGKAAVPVWLFLYFFQNEHYYIATAFFAMIGHIYPIFHGFIGGRGLSPLIGSLLVINWYGLIIGNLAAGLLGYLTGAVLVMRWAWMGIMIIWFALIFKDPWLAGYMAAASFLFFFAMRKELATALKIARSRKSSQEEVSEFMLMGKKLGRFIDQYSVPALIKKIFNR